MKKQFIVNMLDHFVLDGKEPESHRTFVIALKLLKPYLLEVRSTKRCPYCKRQFKRIKKHLHENKFCSIEYYKDLMYVVHVVEYIKENLVRETISYYYCNVCWERFKHIDDAIEHIIKEHRNRIPPLIIDFIDDASLW